MDEDAAAATNQLWRVCSMQRQMLLSIADADKACGRARHPDFTSTIAQQAAA